MYVQHFNIDEKNWEGECKSNLRVGSVINKGTTSNNFQASAKLEGKNATNLIAHQAKSKFGHSSIILRKERDNPTRPKLTKNKKSFFRYSEYFKSQP